MIIFIKKNDHSELKNRLKKPACSQERATGIEPVTNAWEAFILPLNYARDGLDYSQGKGDCQVVLWINSIHI